MKVGRDMSITELIRDMDARKAGFLARARADFKSDGIVVREPNMQPGWQHVLTKSARPGVEYQITRIDETGEPIGHSEHADIDVALKQLWDNTGLQSTRPSGRPAADPIPRALPKLHRGRLVRL